MNSALLSSKRIDWETPVEFFEELNKDFNFTLDLCASSQNRKCDRFYSIDNSCLDKEPHGERIFCNPLYGREISQFVKKCYELSKNNIVVMLIPARTDTAYFHNFIYQKAEIRFIRGRLKFTNPETKGPSSPAPFPSMVAIFR